jgi:hypothetical protein
MFDYLLKHFLVAILHLFWRGNRWCGRVDLVSIITLLIIRIFTIEFVLNFDLINLTLIRLFLLLKIFEALCLFILVT